MEQQVPRKGLVEFAKGELRRVSLGGLDNRRFAPQKQETSRLFCGFAALPYSTSLAAKLRRFEYQATGKNKTDILSDVRLFLVGAKGLEPLTSCV